MGGTTAERSATPVSTAETDLRLRSLTGLIHV